MKHIKKNQSSLNTNNDYVKLLYQLHKIEGAHKFLDTTGFKTTLWFTENAKPKIEALIMSLQPQAATSTISKERTYNNEKINTIKDKYKSSGLILTMISSKILENLETFWDSKYLETKDFYNGNSFISTNENKTATNISCSYINKNLKEALYTPSEIERESGLTFSKQKYLNCGLIFDEKSINCLGGISNGGLTRNQLVINEAKIEHKQQKQQKETTENLNKKYAAQGYIISSNNIYRKNSSVKNILKGEEDSLLENIKQNLENKKNGYVNEILVEHPEEAFKNNKVQAIIIDLPYIDEEETDAISLIEQKENFKDIKNFAKTHDLPILYRYKYELYSQEELNNQLPRSKAAGNLPKKIK